MSKNIESNNPQVSVQILEKLPYVGKTASERFLGGLKILSNLPPEYGYDELKNMSEGMWLTMSEKQLNKYERIFKVVQKETAKIVSKNEQLESVEKLNVEPIVFGEHLQMMRSFIEIYWDEIVKNKLVPPGTTKFFAIACVLSHDFSRNANMNGLPISIADNTSHDMLALAFPGFPQDQYIHDVEYIFGTKELPPEEGNFFMYFLKLIDTYGKLPRRFVKGFFSKDGPHYQWLQTQVEAGTIPFMVKGKEITAEVYRENDLKFTMRAYRLVQKMIPNLKFYEQINEAADMVGNRR